MLDQRQRRWVDIVQMLYICLVFAGSPGGVNLQVVLILNELPGLLLTLVLLELYIYVF